MKLITLFVFAMGALGQSAIIAPMPQFSLDPPAGKMCPDGYHWHSKNSTYAAYLPIVGDDKCHSSDDKKTAALVDVKKTAEPAKGPSGGGLIISGVTSPYAVEINVKDLVTADISAGMTLSPQKIVEAYVCGRAAGMAQAFQQSGHPELAQAARKIATDSGCDPYDALVKLMKDLKK